MLRANCDAPSRWKNRRSMEALFNIPSVPPKEKGRIASLPNSAMIFLKREVISSRASSHVMRCHSCVERALARVPWPLRPHSPHGIQNPVGRIHPIQILRHLGAQETTRYRMRRITLDFGRASVLHRNQNSAGIRAIVRTGGVDNLLHDLPIIRCRVAIAEKSIRKGNEVSQRFEFG